MNKLYLIAIGGSGTRVMKALIMQLAAGYYVPVEKIVPMVIDTDVNNGDLEYFRGIVKCYQGINQKLYNNRNVDIPNMFFRTPVDTPKELNISGNDFGTLNNMLDYMTLNAKGHQSTKSLIDLLFSKGSREMNLGFGFLGIPSVGSIVLREVVESKGFKEFTQDFKPGDRIFIISSIFGGTGAAGFPLLLNIFRDPDSGINNARFINEAIIGGVSLQPYFEVDVEKFEKGESPINSNTFISKTKAALAYYEKYLASNLNAMFYIGDTRKSNFPNNPGGKDQLNPANFIEFISAMSVIRFLNYESEAKNINELKSRIKYFEFGIKEDLDNVNLTHLGSNKDEYIKQFIKFNYFSIYISNYLDAALSNQHMAWTNRISTPPNFKSSELVKQLKEFTSKYFYQWLFQMGNDYHGRKFVPFNIEVENISDVKRNPYESVKLQVNNKKLFHIVNSISARDNSNLFRRDKIDFDQTFNEFSVKVSKNTNLQSFEQRFITLLNSGVDNIYSEKYLN